MMGGYAIYVWPCYGIVLVVLILLTMIPYYHHQKIKKQINKLMDREQRLKKSNESRTQA